MTHRIREAMRDLHPAPLGGDNEIVEIDETYVCGKTKNRAFKAPPPKEAVVALVERDGNVRSFHVANVTATTLRAILVTQINRASYVMTDEAPVYGKVGAKFKGHGTVNHSIDE